MILNEDRKREIVFGKVGGSPIKKGGGRSFVLPSTPGFMGRKEELGRLSNEFPLKHIFIIEGMAGSGKTYLGAYFAHQMQKDYRIFFGECRPDLGLSTLLREINDFLITQGETSFGFVLEDMNLDTVHKIKQLIDILERERYILIFDDFHYLDQKEAGELLTWFDRFFDKTRVILLTREVPHFTKYLKPNNLVEIVLGGFSESETIAYLSNLLKADEETLKKVFKKTNGLPLALNLFASLSRYYKIEELLGILPDYAKEVINQNLIDQVFATLNEDEIKLLTRFAVLRRPVPTKALSYFYPEANWEKVFVGLVDKLQLKRTEDDLVTMHPLIREFAYEKCYEKRKWHITAARYYLSLGPDLENALEAHYHYLEAGEYDQAAQITIQIGDELIRRGDAELAYRMLKQSLGRASSNKDPELHLLLGKIFQLWARFDEAITEYTWAYDHSPDLEIKALAQNQIGGVYLCKGDSRKAYPFLQESLSLRREINNRGGIAESLHQMGVLHLVKGEYSDAVKFLLESLEITESLNDKGALAETLNEIGRVYFYQKEYDKALARLNEALLLSKESGNRRAQATILHNMGSIYLETNDLASALPLFEEGLRIREEIGDILGQGHTLYQLGNLYLEEKDYKKARSYLNKSKAIFEELGALNDAQYPQHLLEAIANL